MTRKLNARKIKGWILVKGKAERVQKVWKHEMRVFLSWRTAEAELVHLRRCGFKSYKLLRVEMVVKR